VSKLRRLMVFELLCFLPVLLPAQGGAQGYETVGAARAAVTPSISGNREFHCLVGGLYSGSA
jgi:hypothetical protein